jgi:hypothetical protein
MYEIEVDRRTNRLLLDFSGHLERETLEEAAAETVEAAEQLDDGFDIINDLSGFAPPSPEAAKPIKRAQAKLKEMGVDRVVRVADEDTSQVVINAFERRSKDVGYSGETADSVLEAQQLLEEEHVEGYAAV